MFQTAAYALLAHPNLPYFCPLFQYLAPLCLGHPFVHLLLLIFIVASITLVISFMIFKVNCDLVAESIQHNERRLLASLLAVLGNLTFNNSALINSMISMPLFFPFFFLFLKLWKTANVYWRSIENESIQRNEVAYFVIPIEFRPN